MEWDQATPQLKGSPHMRDRDEGEDDRRVSRRAAPRPVGVRREGSRHGFPADDYGSWDGRTSSIPGRITRNDKPDMRDALNLEKFKGESYEDRRDRIASNSRRPAREERSRDRVDRSSRREQPRSRSNQQESNPLDTVDEMMDMVQELDDRDLLPLAERVADLQQAIIREVSLRERPRSGGNNGGGGGRSSASGEGTRQKHSPPPDDPDRDDDD